jgi:hypothetical protein
LSVLGMLGRWTEVMVDSYMHDLKGCVFEICIVSYFFFDLKGWKYGWK